MKYQYRELNRSDLPFLMAVRNSCAKEFLHDDRCFTMTETLYWFENTQPEFYVIWDNDKRLGYFRTSDRSNLNIMIGADIHEDFRNQGICYTAYMEFIPILFEKFGLNKISLEVLANNVRAIHLYEKIGFKYEGRKRQEVLRNGQFIDSLIMSILREEWDEA